MYQFLLIGPFFCFFFIFDLVIMLTCIVINFNVYSHPLVLLHIILKDYNPSNYTDLLLFLVF